MKKFVKLFRFVLVTILAIFFLVCLSVGALREIGNVREETISYYEYSLEGQEYGFRKYENKICLVKEGVEFDCQVTELSLSVLVNEAQIEAIMTEDLSVIKVLIVSPEASPEAEPEYLDFIKNEEQVVLTNSIKTVYSDYVMDLLDLYSLEESLGEHYFNTIASSLAGSTLITLLYLVIKGSKKNSKSIKNKKDIKHQDSLRSQIPTPINPTQGNHNLKF